MPSFALFTSTSVRVTSKRGFEPDWKKASACLKWLSACSDRFLRHQHKLLRRKQCIVRLLYVQDRFLNNTLLIKFRRARSGARGIEGIAGPAEIIKGLIN